MIQAKAIQNSTGAVGYGVGASIFWLPSHSLEAVEGVSFDRAPPLYTASLACNAKKNTKAHNHSNVVRQSIFFRMITKLKIR